MPSKPPTSKAFKSARRTAKKLPSKIAKRFKKKTLKEQREEEVWSNKEKQKTSTIIPTKKAELDVPPVVMIAGIPVPADVSTRKKIEIARGIGMYILYFMLSFFLLCYSLIIYCKKMFFVLTFSFLLSFKNIANQEAFVHAPHQHKKGKSLRDIRMKMRERIITA